MTADQKFLKAVHIRPDDPKAENWMEWRDEDISKMRINLAEAVRELHQADSRAIERETRMNMWKLAAFAGWLGLFLFAMQGHW